MVDYLSKTNSSVLSDTATNANGTTFVLVCLLHAFVKNWLHVGNKSTDDISVSDGRVSVSTEDDMAFNFSYHDCSHYYTLRRRGYGICGDENNMTDIVDCVLYRFMVKMDAERKCPNNKMYYYYFWPTQNSELRTWYSPRAVSPVWLSKIQVFYSYMVESLGVDGMCVNDAAWGSKNENNVREAMLSKRKCLYYSDLQVREAAEEVCANDIITPDNHVIITYYDCFWYRLMGELGAKTVCKELLAKLRSRRHNQEICRSYSCVMDLIGGIVCIIGITCNVLTLHMFCSGAVKLPTSYQLIALAVVDVILLVLWVVLVLNYEMFYFNINSDSPYMRVIHFVISICIWPFYRMAHTSTNWLTVFIAVYRYVAICKPTSNKYSHLEQHGKKYVMMVIVVAVLYNIPRFWDWHLEQDERYDGQVEYRIFEKLVLGTRYWVIMYAVFIVYIPFLILGFVTTRMLVKIWQRKRRNKSSQNSQDNVTVILLSILVTFIICHIPRIIYPIIEPRIRCDDGFLFYLSMTGKVFVAVNSAANPFIYFFLNKSFRSALATRCHC